MKITAGKVTQERDIVADKDFLSVPWAITDFFGGDDVAPAGDLVVLEGVQAFELTATADEVGEFLKKKLMTYKENLALHEGAQEQQAAQANGEVVAGQITNLSISE